MTNDLTESTATAQQAMLRAAIVAAVVAVALLATALGVRTLIAEDLGYHVAYGQRFWSSGEIVDHSDFLFTTSEIQTTAFEPPPAMAGSWYDDQGRYRFPNANWLTQVIFAGVYELAGLGGLNILLMVLVWSVAGMMFCVLCRLRIGLLPATGAWLLMLLIAYERFSLRPELIGYLILLAQMAILAPLAVAPQERTLSKRAVVGLVALQLLLVNAHSYFLIGLGLTAAVAVETAVRRWARSASQAERAALGHNARWLLMVTGLQLAACFGNPWTWRLALLPVHAAMDLAKYGITPSQSTHPWASFRETQRTFLSASEIGQAWDRFLRNGFHGEPTRALLSLALVGAIPAAVVAVWRRRWALLLWLIAGGYIALSMHRNMAVGALLVVPAAAILLQGLATPAIRQWTTHSRWRTACGAGAAMAILGLLLSWMVVTNRCYPQRYQVRFGVGRSRVSFPDAPAIWLNHHQIQGRLWTEVMTSSNLYFLLDPRPEFPILTNSWAYPPAIMSEVNESWRRPNSLGAAVAKYHLSALVVRIDDPLPVVRLLFASSAPKQPGRGQPQLPWVLVHLDGVHAIFLRTDGPDAETAQAQVLTADKWDAAAFIRRTVASDPLPAYSLFATANALSALQWREDELAVLRATVNADPNHVGGWFRLGFVLAIRAHERQLAGDPGWRTDLAAAIKAIKTKVSLENDGETQRMLAALIHWRQTGQSPLTSRHPVAPSGPQR